MREVSQIDFISFFAIFYAIFYPNYRMKRFEFIWLVIRQFNTVKLFTEINRSVKGLSPIAINQPRIQYGEGNPFRICIDDMLQGFFTEPKILQDYFPLRENTNLVRTNLNSSRYVLVLSLG